MRANTWLGRPERKRAILLAALIGALLTVAMSFSLSGPVERLILFGFSLTPWVLGAWCVSRTGLRLSADGIVVRGFFRTRHVSLVTAKAFTPGIQGWWGNGYPAPALERIGANPIPIFTFGREGVVWKFDRYLEELQPVCDQLNALLRELQAQAGQVPALSPPLRSPGDRQGMA